MKLEKPTKRQAILAGVAFTISSTLIFFLEANSEIRPAFLLVLFTISAFKALGTAKMVDFAITRVEKGLPSTLVKVHRFFREAKRNLFKNESIEVSDLLRKDLETLDI